ncbi:MAG: hypothetical protein JSW17_03110 [Candidatus Omnitrophota bacterium]|nr:MAG: hypothetical protein JSW17_03110 [Candidatus Omnitrophota bacterium]
MKKIILINIYIGKLPNWINLFLQTCKNNPTIDWLIFSNDKTPNNTPPNVKIVNTDLNRIVSLARKKTDTKVRIFETRAICNLKPAYGVIFEDYLHDYDFWGHCDLDIMCGDIRKFITEKMLDQYDVISSCILHIAGPFTIYRNCAKINYLFKENPKYKEAFEKGKNVGFDEVGFGKEYFGFDLTVTQAQEKGLIKVAMQKVALRDKNNKKWLKNLIKKVKPIKKHIKFEREKAGICYYKNGKIFHKKTNEEFMYFHFLKWKKRMFLPLMIEWDDSIKYWEMRKRGIKLFFNSKRDLFKYYTGNFLKFPAIVNIALYLLKIPINKVNWFFRGLTRKGKRCYRWINSNW